MEALMVAAAGFAVFDNLPIDLCRHTDLRQESGLQGGFGGSSCRISYSFDPRRAFWYLGGVCMNYDL
jgi:hypothetical protein